MEERIQEVNRELQDLEREYKFMPGAMAAGKPRRADSVVAEEDSYCASYGTRYWTQESLTTLRNLYFHASNARPHQDKALTLPTGCDGIGGSK